MFSLSDALVQLENANQAGEIFSIEQLRELADSLSVEMAGAEGKTSVFYSGDIKPGQLNGEAWRVLDDLPDGQYRVLNNPDVVQLLRSDEFRIALTNSVKSFTSPDQVVEKVNEIFNGSVVNGKRIPDGLWDDASQRFAEAASGDVRVIAPYGKSETVFAQTELPTLLNNEKVTTIDGIPRSQLVQLRDT
uniref:hypothetical protein n=1 Tax=Seonamhaeicola sp. TaxID=1912245 RepID=UPI00260E04F4